MKPWVILASVALLAAGIIIAAAIFRPESHDVKLNLGLAKARGEILTLRDEVAMLKLRDPAPPPPAAPSDNEALRASVAALEAEVKKLREEKAKTDAPRTAEQLPQLIFTLASEPKPEEIPGLQATAMNPSMSAEERVKALSRLRSTREGRTREVAASMLQLLETSEDAGIRADILRQLHRALPPDLKDPVLRRLQLDTEAKVREEAAETLGPLKADPAVKSALEQAAQSDADLKVRAQALQSLNDRR